MNGGRLRIVSEGRRPVDERLAIPQASHPMRLLLVLLATVGVATTVTAQSNSIPSQSLSLDESIQMAVEHNFDVQIERYNPRLRLYDLRGAYAGYDPLFSVSGQHDFS